MKVLIIGGVAGGATAAARLRRLDEQAEIIILERSGYISYANCGLPYYVGGVITKKEALTLQTPQSFWNRFRIQVRVRHEALSIDREKKTVKVRRLDDGTEYQESYDKLILTPGAKPVKPPLKGVDLPEVFTLRNVEDTYRMDEFIQSRQPKTAVVVGGGFIGLELAENLLARGIQVTLLERLNQVMTPIDYDMACGVHAYLRGKGLDLQLKVGVTGLEKQGEMILVHREGQEPIAADFVVMAVGVAPDTVLAKSAGLTLGIKDAIVTDTHMRTSDPDIYAAGDAVEVRNYVSGERALVSLAGPANKQGRIIADNLCGIPSEFQGAQGSSVVKLFDMTVASTGLNEKQAQQAGISYDKVVTFSASHATYYPGATNMTVKTLFEKDTGKVIGAQIVGMEGVDKRIDVFATAIRGGMTTADLEELELAYAPPYSSAKDPVNMAGFLAENVRSGLVAQHHWYDMERIQQDPDAILLDVRMDSEYARGHMPGTVHIPLDSLRERVGELDPNKMIYVNCQSGLRSYVACRILSQLGFRCSNFSGGYRFYELVVRDCGYDQEPKHPCGIAID